MKTLRTTSVSTLTLMLSLALASPATAASAADQAAAEVLFQEGQKLAAAGDFEHACPKFAESQRLDAGAGTLLNLGNCYEKLGKLASAWGAFKEAESTARHAGSPDKEAEATRRATALAPKLPKLSIVVPPAARMPGFEVRRDGELVGEGQWGSPLPVDPGHHTIEATAAGYKPWSTVMRVDENGGTAQIEIPPLEKLSPAVGETLGSPTQRRLGLSAIGVGGAGLLVGAITLGLDAIKNASLAKQCPMGRCAASLQPDINAYHTLGLVSSTSLIAGSALTAAGVILVLVTPSTKPAPISPVVGPGYAGLSGRF